MSPQEKIHKRLIEEGKTLALAESCTGGKLSAKITAIADASKYFLGSLVVYSNQMKENFLGVSHQTLQKSGAVSRETADEMLIGLMKRTDADLGIAITGIAGPTGKTPEKPVGTVYIAVGERGKKPHIFHCTFEGSREKVIEQSCIKALEELYLLL